MEPEAEKSPNSPRKQQDGKLLPRGRSFYEHGGSDPRQSLLGVSGKPSSLDFEIVQLHWHELQVKNSTLKIQLEKALKDKQDTLNMGPANFLEVYSNFERRIEELKAMHAKLEDEKDALRKENRERVQPLKDRVSELEERESHLEESLRHREESLRNRAALVVALSLALRHRVAMVAVMRKDIATLLDNCRSKADTLSKLKSDKRRIMMQRSKTLQKLNDAEQEKDRMESERMAMEFSKSKHHEKMHAAIFIQGMQRMKRAKTETELRRTKSSLDQAHKMVELTAAAVDAHVDLERALGNERKSKAPIKIWVHGAEWLLEDGLCRILGFKQDDVRRRREQGANSPSKERLDKESGSKFFRPAVELILGRPEAAALGIASYLKVDLFDLFRRCMEGTPSIVKEFAESGTEMDKEQVQYVLYEAAGSSSKKFNNGVRDVGRNGERLADFCNHESARKAELNEAHVLALRLYTTSCYRSLNEPLRDQERTHPHPFPCTIFFLTDAIKRLRAVYTSGDGGTQDAALGDLWRGMRNLKANEAFEAHGGSELAPMSTTTNPAVAVAYGQSAKTLVLKIVTKSFMNRGADIQFLSAFPEEKEILFPPLTFLCPTGRKEVVTIPNLEGELLEFTVLEVEPQM